MANNTGRGSSKGSGKPSSSGGYKGKSSGGSGGYKGKSSGSSSGGSGGYKGKSSGSSSGGSGGYKGKSSGSSSGGSGGYRGKSSDGRYDGTGGYRGKSSGSSSGGSGGSSSSGSGSSSGYRGKSSDGRSDGTGGYRGKSSGSSSSGSGGYRGKSSDGRSDGTGGYRGKSSGSSSSGSGGYRGKSSDGRSDGYNAKPTRTSGASSGRPKPSGAKKGHYSATTRDVAEQKRMEGTQRRRDLQGAAVNLPNWIIENLARVTPKDRVAPALEALGAASEALSEGRYQSAVKHGQRAKSLSPNDSTVRETIGVAAYRVGDWTTALTELRAYRRIAGETTHLPIEMDVLRALGRDADVEKAWLELKKRGGHGIVMNEGIVVYSSYLLDNGRAKDAWAIANPGRTVAEPNEAHLRLYFVAGRAAAALGDRSTAKTLSDAIVLADPGFPGWEQLESEIAAIS